jgi:hypothetical protein
MKQASSRQRATMLRVPLTVLCALAATATLVGIVADTAPGSADGPSAGLTTGVAAPLPVRRPLPFFYDLYTFRGDDHATTVVAAFAVPAGRLKSERENREVKYRFDVTLVLADTVLREVSRTDDSVVVAAPDNLTRDHLLYTHVQVEAPPSGSTIQRVIMTDASTPGIGQLYGTPFPIPDYTGSELMLSDIALGRPDIGAGWRRGDVTLALLPTSQFPEGPFDVYYEIYNLPPGSRYDTEISIEPYEDPDVEAGQGERSVRTSFSARSTAQRGESQAELRRLEASLPQGSYRLAVTVTDEATGQTATGSRVFQVRALRRGATLIPALPRGIRTEPVG